MGCLQTLLRGLHNNWSYRAERIYQNGLGIPWGTGLTHYIFTLGRVRGYVLSYICILFRQANELILHIQQEGGQ